MVSRTWFSSLGNRIKSYGQRRGYGTHDFDRVCRVLFLSRAKDEEGNVEEGVIGEGDLIVMGLKCGRNIYRGLVSYGGLMTSPVNQINPGSKYRFRSRLLPERRGDPHRILRIDEVVTSRTPRFKRNPRLE